MNVEDAFDLDRVGVASLYDGSGRNAERDARLNVHGRLGNVRPRKSLDVLERAANVKGSTQTVGVTPVSRQRISRNRTDRAALEEERIRSVLRDHVVLDGGHASGIRRQILPGLDAAAAAGANIVVRHRRGAVLQVDAMPSGIAAAVPNGIVGDGTAGHVSRSDAVAQGVLDRAVAHCWAALVEVKRRVIDRRAVVPAIANDAMFQRVVAVADLDLTPVARLRSSSAAVVGVAVRGEYNRVAGRTIADHYASGLVPSLSWILVWRIQSQRPAAIEHDHDACINSQRGLPLHIEPRVNDVRAPRRGPVVGPLQVRGNDC